MTIASVRGGVKQYRTKGKVRPAWGPSRASPPRHLDTASDRSSIGGVEEASPSDLQLDPGAQGHVVGSFVESSRTQIASTNDDVHQRYCVEDCSSFAERKSSESMVVETEVPAGQEGPGIACTISSATDVATGSPHDPSRHRCMPGSPTRHSIVLGVGTAIGESPQNQELGYQAPELEVRSDFAAGNEGVGLGNLQVSKVFTSERSDVSTPTSVHPSFEKPTKRAFSECIFSSNGACSETPKPDLHGPLHSKRGCTSISEQGGGIEGHLHVPNAQIPRNDEGVYRPHACSEGISSTDSPFADGFSQIDEKTHILQLYSTLGLGEGPLRHGFGRETLGSLLSPIQFSDLRFGLASELSSVTASVKTWSSGSISSDSSVDGEVFRPPSVRSNRKLAPITTNILDVGSILRWDTDGEFREVHQYIADYDRFKSLFTQSPIRHLRRSKILPSNIELLINYDVLEHTETFACCLGSFQVPKKGDEDRFIGDASPLNKIQQKPMKALIPQLHEVLHELMQRKYFFSVDAVSFFYQFLIEDERIRSFFTFAMNRKRGRPLLMRLRRLCMGWKFSPCIAQRAARVILKKIALEANSQGISHTSFVWIDNFLFGTDTFQDAQRLQLIVKDVFKQCNLEHHPFSEISTTLHALGFEISFGMCRHSTKFIEHFKNATLRETATYRDVAIFIGNCIWTIYARQLPLCFFPSVVETLRAMHVRMPRKKGCWDLPLDKSIFYGSVPRLVHETQHLRDTCCHSWTVQKPPSGTWTELHSDAMVDETGATWAWTSGDAVYQGVFDFTSHIFIHELIAACQSLLDVAKQNPHGKAMLFSDNTAVVFALRAAHSGNVVADQILERFYSMLPQTFFFKIAHVCSDFNMADPYTRGQRGHRGSTLAQSTTWG